MTVSEAEKLFVSGTSLAVICGKVSRNLECMDFDNPSLFSPFLKTLTDVAPDLKGISNITGDLAKLAENLRGKTRDAVIKADKNEQQKT